MKMINTTKLLILFSAAMVLVGCDMNRSKQVDVDMSPKQTGNACPGKGVGGPLLGNMISGPTQQETDQTDENLARMTAKRALDNAPDGMTQSWRNPNTDIYGQSTVTETLDGGSCRVLHSIVFDEHSFQLGRETVKYCKGADGEWLSQR